MGNARSHVRREPEPEDQFLVPTDPLSQVTDQVRLSSLFGGIVRVKLPFTHASIRDGLHVLVVTQGQMYVELSHMPDVAPILAETGDVLVVARPFRFFYPFDAPCTLESHLTRVVDSSKAQPDDVEILGMLCYLDKAHRNLLTDFLPSVIHLKRGTPGLRRWLKQTVDLFRSEYQTRALGRCSILSRLTEIACVQVLRLWIDQMPSDAKGWLRGLKDERISLALQAIHNDPGHRWTVESLAHLAGMSRTVFATRFKALVGESPMEYVSRWRMHRAAGLLDEGAGNLKSVVGAAGYKSASRFRLNFKRQFGVLPSDYRRMQPQPLDGA